MITRADIDMIVAYKRTLPKDVSIKDLIYYYCVSCLYDAYKVKKITKQEASARKKEIISYLDTMESLAKSNSQIIHTLSISLAPRKDSIQKDKAELLEVISRVEGVATGIMKSFDSEIPNFLKMEG